MLYPLSKIAVFNDFLDIDLDEFIFYLRIYGFYELNEFLFLSTDLRILRILRIITTTFFVNLFNS